MDVRCPHCNTPMDVVEDDPLSEITCENCGSTFSLLSGESTVSFHDPAQRSIGQFQLIESVGRGQYGDVWKARDTEGAEES